VEGRCQKLTPGKGDEKRGKKGGKFGVRALRSKKKRGCTSIGTETSKTVESRCKVQRFTRKKDPKGKDGKRVIVLKPDRGLPESQEFWARKNKKYARKKLFETQVG